MHLDSVYVVVRSMEKAVRFYGELFATAPAVSEDRFSSFQLGQALFSLLNAGALGEPVDTEHLTYGNNCVPNVRVADLDTRHARIARLGPPGLTPIRNAGHHRYFHVVDPDGNRVEFYQEG